jgi:hypothetical protein
LCCHYAPLIQILKVAVFSHSSVRCAKRKDFFVCYLLEISEIAGFISKKVTKGSKYKQTNLLVKKTFDAYGVGL